MSRHENVFILLCGDFTEKIECLGMPNCEADTLHKLYAGSVHRYSSTQIKGQTSNQYCPKDV